MLRSAMLTAALLATLPACKADLCQEQDPAVELAFTLGPNLTADKVATLEVKLEAAGRKKQAQLTVGDALNDGRTSIAWQLGAAATGGFTLKYTVTAMDSAGKSTALHHGSEQGSGDACNFFSVTLTGEGSLDGGAAHDSTADGP